MDWTHLDDLSDWTPKTGSRSMETITTYSKTVPLKKETKYLECPSDVITLLSLLNFQSTSMGSLENIYLGEIF